jgi:hemoglobin-like flavoprotein
MLTDATSPPVAAPATADFDVSPPIRACCEELQSSADDLVLHLHQEILEAMPTATGRLAGNGRVLSRRLALAVLDAAASDQPPGHAGALVQRVGADNYAEGFPSEQYGWIVHALLRAARSSYGGEWTNALSSGCVEYFIWVRDQLTAGAAAAQGPARPPHPATAPNGARSHRLDDAHARGRRPAAASPAGALGDLDELDDEDAEDPGYGELMVAMTLNSKRDRRRRT